MLVRQSSRALVFFMLISSPRFARSLVLSMSSAARKNSILSNKNLVTIDECLAASKHSLDDSSSNRVVFVDGSWHLDPTRDGRADFEAGPRITGARYFDINDISAKGTDLNPKGLPHMRPPKKLFSLAMDASDIQNSDHVIVYGTKGCLFTSRTWYTFRDMGHDPTKIHLMQGSLQEWENEGGPIETGVTSAIKAADLDLNKEAVYQATDNTQFCDMTQVLKVINDGDDADSIIIDARSEGRFTATAPEPRAGMRGGHMPKSLNLPFTKLLRAEDVTKLKDVEELKLTFQSAGVDILTDKKIICSCGSGASACVIAAALEECGRDQSMTRIYDGSWTEWGSDPNTPIVS